MNMKRFIILTAALAALSWGQTRTEPEQIKFPNGAGPALFVILADGTPKQVLLGPSLLLVNNGGILSLNAVAPAPPANERPDTQQLILEPDNLSWRVPVPINKPHVFRNGVRMFLGKDYVLEQDATKQVVRPTQPQGMKTTDIWLAS